MCGLQINVERAGAPARRVDKNNFSIIARHYRIIEFVDALAFVKGVCQRVPSAR